MLASGHQITPSVCVLTSHSNRPQQGADRCIACKRCPSRFHPVSSASPRTHTELDEHMVEEELKIIHFFINWWFFFKGKCLGFFFKKGYKELDLTSGAEVALHGCSRATAGPQKKPYGSKQQVNPEELHLYHVWSACDSASPFLPSFICFEGSWPWRGGVACTVMWPTDLAVESVSGAIRWEWGGGGVV